MGDEHSGARQVDDVEKKKRWEHWLNPDPVYPSQHPFCSVQVRQIQGPNGPQSGHTLCVEVTSLVGMNMIRKKE